jgi:hypothetical protein
MTYTAAKPPLRTSIADLRADIPGWGADVDRADRPSVPREVYAPEATGAHWDFPDRQVEHIPRERSIEHGILPPVFGTSCPPKGLSGVLRRHAYARYSEGRAAHWLILIAADRVDAIESHARSMLTPHPDNPVTQTGVLSERRRHGISSRFGQRRADVNHAWIDPILVAGPWVALGGVAVAGARALARRIGS